MQPTQTTDVLVFNVGMGQSIFVYPHGSPEYGMMIDCGHEDDFHPVDFLLENNLIHTNTAGQKELSNLTLTNYDHDHFSGIVNLRNKVHIKTVSFANNLTSQEIAAEKPQHTDHLAHVYDIKEKYNTDAVNYTPPYIKHIYSLRKEDLDVYDTNNLSQVVFIEQHGTVICISGDMEGPGWTALLAKEPGVRALLARTNVFIAAHHGRESGYHADVFTHCSPECVIISDKAIVHETQKDMASVYANHVSTGIVLSGVSLDTRKVLTTRNDGHLLVRLTPSGGRQYTNLVIS